MLFTVCVPAFSAVTSGTVINDTTLKKQYLKAFNTSVNSIKTYCPACSISKSYTLSDPIVSSKDGGEIGENAQKWIKWIIDACFKGDAGLANTLFSTIFGDTSVPEEASFAYGEIRNNRVPVCGEKYVSNLTVKDDFSLVQQTTGGTKLKPESALTYTKIVFPNVALEDVNNSSLSKIFNLTKGEINPVIASNYQSSGENSNVLEGVTFEDFTFKNPTAVAVTDSDGKLITYYTDISYSFSLSIEDLINMISATAGYDFMSIVMGIANTILTNTDKATMTPGQLLNTRYLYIVYNVHIELSDFTWDRRSFGDADKKDGVTVDDARIILRHAIGIQTITNKTSLIYCDMNFNGKITVADARLALRTALGKNKEFTYVPDGKTIKIAEVADAPVSSEEEVIIAKDEGTPTEDEASDSSVDVGAAAADMTQAIIDIVNGVRGVSDAGVTTVDDIIEYFKSIGK